VIHAERRGPVAVVTIDRPERRNAVDHEALRGLAAALEGAVADRCRALVLQGAGGHFCAGADLTGVEDASFAELLRGVLVGLGEVPLVTIAAVEGAALGAGTQLAAACDLRVAAEDAVFGIPAGKLGLAVDQWTVDRVVLLAGAGTARAMLLAAEVVRGADAHRLGLVQRLGPVDAALAWAEEIAGLAPLTIQAHKAALRDGPDAPDAFRRAWASHDFAEGLAAFRERRPPRFQGR
jgi:enoyl-CoA hydratase